MSSMQSFDNLTKKLEVVFGPDTGDLRLKVGIHSGAITGGFLRGKGARFQLFGDTTNAAHEVAMTSEPGRIQVSEHTADLLIKAGKSKWLHKRQDVVMTKSHGNMSTYWLYQSQKGSGSVGTADESAMSDGMWHISQNPEATAQQRRQRLISWNVEVLHGMLKQIVSRREAMGPRPLVMSNSVDPNATRTSITLSSSHEDASMPLEEVKEIITMPEFDKKVAKRMKDAGDITLPRMVLEELNDYVTSIAEMYQDNVSVWNRWKHGEA